MVPRPLRCLQLPLGEIDSPVKMPGPAVGRKDPMHLYWNFIASEAEEQLNEQELKTVGGLV